MKNLIYILFAAIILASCSSENDNMSPSSNETKLYTVNLSVKNPSLIVDQNGLRSAIDDGNLKRVQVSLYKSTGEIYTNLGFNIDDIKQEDGSLLIPLKLPANNYKFAILGSSKSNFLASFNSKNYYNDYYYAFANDNESIFYTTADISVQPIDEPQNITSIELLPMWSNINMIIEDAQTFDVPEGTNALEFIVSPYYNGFGINDKLATNVYENEITRNIVDLNTIRTNSSYKNTVIVSKTIAENNKLEVSINYLKKESKSEYTILETRELKIPNITIENGYNYNIKGKLNAKDNNQSMNISLGEFNKETVVIDF